LHLTRFTIADDAMTFESNVCVKTIAYIDIDIDDETGIGPNIQTVKIQIPCP
jgi:hypothetical protein